MKASTQKKILLGLAAAAVAIYLAKRMAKPADALTVAAQLQAQGKPVPPSLKKQVADEHLP